MLDNLPELRDIHLPEGVSAFPIAYGWWAMAVCIIGIFILYKLAIVILQKSKKRYALKLLRGLNQNQIKAVAEMSEILRRICIVKYPQATTFTGQQWIDFINSHSKTKLSSKYADLLLNAPYMPESKNQYSQSDIDFLRKFSQQWIGENL